jgi:hypothetical protein
MSMLVAATLASGAARPWQSAKDCPDPQGHRSDAVVMVPSMQAQ